MVIRYTIVALLFFQFIPGKVYSDSFDEPQVRIEGSKLFYEGLLSIGGFDKIKDEIKKSNQKIKWLHINSAGGEIDVSMDIGLWVFNNDLNIRVYNVCLSSCANYIFSAGKDKVIEKNAIVAWHGSAMQDSLNDLPSDQIENILSQIEDPQEKKEERKKIINSHKKYMANMKKKQENFFETIGVDQRITVIGQSGNYKVNNFWSFSVKDMEKFGIANVTAPDNYTESQVFKSGKIVLLKITEGQ